MEYINNLPTAKLYFAMSKYSQEQKETKNNSVEQIISDTVDEIVDSIGDESDNDTGNVIDSIEMP